MGKKHKKHHRHDVLPPQDEPKPLRLVLKVGGHSSSTSVLVPPSPSVVSRSSSIDTHHYEAVPEGYDPHEVKKKKKKKKKSKSMEIEQKFERIVPISVPEYSIQRTKHKHKHHKHKHRGNHPGKFSESTSRDLGDPWSASALSFSTPFNEGAARSWEDPAALKLKIPVNRSSFVDKYLNIRSPEVETEMLATNRPDRQKDKKLKAVLLRYVSSLQRKDVHKFFAMPVSDSFAPGYSRIIKKPMDFKKIHTKIEKSLYSSVDEFKDDIERMCINCTVYNGRDTIYYREAVKLLAHAIKMMRNDLSPSKCVMPAALSLSGLAGSLVGSLTGAGDEEINVTDVDGGTDSRSWLNFPGSRSYGLLDPSDNVTPDLNEKAEEIIQQTAKVAKEARQKVQEKRNKMGTLHCADDGSTKLTILNPDADKENETVSVTLGSIAGAIQQGKNRLNAPLEKTKSQPVPVSYLFYGPFSSFAPLSFPSDTKEENELISIYGDKTGVKYAQSLQRFVSGASSQAQAIVAELLSGLTDGKHSAAMKDKKATEVVAKPKEINIEEKKMEANAPIDLDSLLSLEKEGIDVSFLSGSSVKSESSESMQTVLSENARRLENLHEIQNKRLSEMCDGLPGSHADLAAVEKQLGMEVAKSLTGVASKVNPGDVVPMEGVRLALGLQDTRMRSKTPGGSTGSTGGMSLLKQLGLDSDSDD